MVAGQCCYYVVGDLKLRRCRQKPGPKDQPISETAGVHIQEIVQISAHHAQDKCDVLGL